MPTYTYTKTGLQGPIFLPKKVTVFAVEISGNAEAIIEVSYDPPAVFKRDKKRPLWRVHGGLADVLFDATAIRINLRKGRKATLTINNKEDITHD